MTSNTEQCERKGGWLHAYNSIFLVSQHFAQSYTDQMFSRLIGENQEEFQVRTDTNINKSTVYTEIIARQNVARTAERFTLLFLFPEQTQTPPLTPRRL